MKNIKLLLLATMLLLASMGKSQIIVMNGDTLHPGDTVYYCSTVNVTIQNNDTVGIAPHSGWSFIWGASVPGKRVLTSGTFTPLAVDTTLWLIYAYYANSHLGFWNDTSANGWYDYADTASWQDMEIHLIKKTPTSKICWVTVDSNFAHNVIIWDTSGFAAENIDSIKIYYYITFNTRKLLATKPRVGNTYFVDSVNNPQSGTFKYLLTGVNSCNNEDTSSAWQTTAWIQQAGSTFTVSSPYTVKGNPTPVSYYILYRDTTGSGHNWDSIFETPGTVLNDPNYAHYPSAKYYVAAVLNLPGCSTPVIVNRMESLPANKSRSNRVNNSVAGIAAVMDAKSFNAYPNPFNNTLNLYLQQESDVRIYNELGQMVFHSYMPVGYNKVTMDGATGLYLLNVNGYYKKLIKE